MNIQVLNVWRQWMDKLLVEHRQIEYQKEHGITDPDHECKMLSGCCGIEEHEYIEGMCGGCNEMVYDFECSICVRKDVYV